MNVKLHELSQLSDSISVMHEILVLTLINFMLITRNIQEWRKPLEKPDVKENSTDEKKRRTLIASFQNILKIRGRSQRFRFSR